MMYLLFPRRAQRLRVPALAGLLFSGVLACQTFDLPNEDEPGCFSDCGDVPDAPVPGVPPDLKCPGLSELRVAHDPGGLNAMGGRVPKQLFTWLSPEELDEFLKSSKERAPSAGQNQLLVRMRDQFESLALNGASLESQQLAYYLSENLEKVAPTWPRAFALRQSMGESRRYPVRLQLAEDAWWAAFDGRSLGVFLSSGASVDTASALLTPERIQAIYFEDSLQENSFGSACELGFVEPDRNPLARAVLLTETAQIVSVETEGAELLAAVEEEISVLENFFHSFRASPIGDEIRAGNRAQHSCLWSLKALPTGCTEHYFAALAAFDSNHALTRDRLAQLIDTLRADWRALRDKEEATPEELGAGGAAP